MGVILHDRPIGQRVPAPEVGRCDCCNHDGRLLHPVASDGPHPSGRRYAIPFMVCAECLG